MCGCVSTYECVRVYVCMCVCACVRVCVCVVCASFLARFWHGLTISAEAMRRCADMRVRKSICLYVYACVHA